MTRVQVNIIPVREQPLILRDVTRKLSHESHVLTDPAVSEWALRSHCHMHPERTVSFRPDAHKVLLLAHAQRVWGGDG